MTVEGGAKQVTLVTSTGVTFDLSTGAQGVALGLNLGGVHHIPTEHVRQQTAGIDGFDVKGINRGAREIDVNLVVSDEAAEAVLWDGLSFTEPSKWVVVSELGGYRTIDVLLGADPQLVFEKDPAITGTRTYAVTLLCPDPWAKMLPIRRVLPYTEWATAKLYNPGREPVPATWFFTTPGTITMGFPGDTVTLPPQTAGHTVLVDTDPRSPDISSGGVALWSQMGQQRLGALIPRGESSPVLTATGPGAATAVVITYTPIAERFW